LLFESFGFFRLARVRNNPGATVKAAPAELKTSSLSGPVKSPPLARKAENRLI
jgi:hypothetical protein